MLRSAESKMFAHVDLVIAVSCYTLEQDFGSVSCVFTIPRRFSIGFKPSELPGNTFAPEARYVLLASFFSFFERIGCPRIIRTCSFFRDFRHCAETADVVVSKIFRITHQESKLNVTLSPSQHIIPFSH